MVTTARDCAPHSKQVIRGFLFFFSLKHLRIVFGVTNGQTLQFFDSFLRSHSPNPGTPAVMLRIQLWLFVCRALSILFRRPGPSVGLLFLWWKPAAIVQIHFVKGIWKSRWSLCSLERLRAFLCKPRLLSEHPSKRNLSSHNESRPARPCTRVKSTLESRGFFF